MRKQLNTEIHNNCIEGKTQSNLLILQQIRHQNKPFLRIEYNRKDIVLNIKTNIKTNINKK